MPAGTVSLGEGHTPGLEPKGMGAAGRCPADHTLLLPPQLTPRSRQRSTPRRMAPAAKQPRAQVGPGSGPPRASLASRVILGEPGLQAGPWVSSSDGERGWGQGEAMPLIRG